MVFVNILNKYTYLQEYSPALKRENKNKFQQPWMLFPIGFAYSNPDASHLASKRINYKIFNLENQITDSKIFK